ncbi:hypothetical protein HFU84_08615 [Acidithiobacillus sp. CV18-2]|nr:hypothetical protein [Acidithiobacillus sp. CV18-3]MBU2756954.1 hypothetical protein [Acidithiobacillus sp. BN09-2]MBU2777565.1 hypothetical protein [Acidithiobacillus sp. CV18-2]MBU2799665.1 hypothetical protein [Acidithiobacillus sp. VAN18-4]
MDYQKIGNHAWHYSGGSLGRPIDMESARVVLLDASYRCLLDDSLGDSQNATEIMNRMFNSVISRNGTTTRFQSEPESSILQGLFHVFDGLNNGKRLLAIISNPRVATDHLMMQAQATFRLLHDLGFTRYPPLDLTITSQYSHFHKEQKTGFVERISGLVFGVNGVRASASSGSRTESTNSDQIGETASVDEKIKGTGWEPSVFLLEEIQQRLNLPSALELLQYSEDAGWIAQARYTGSYDETYMRVRTAEGVLAKLALRMITSCGSRYGYSDVRQITSLLRGGYMKESLQGLHKLYPPQRPPEMGDWIFHVALYAAQMQGARMRMENEMASTLERGCNTDPKAKPYKVVVERDYDKKPIGDDISHHIFPDNVKFIIDYCRFPIKVENDSDKVCVHLYPDLTVKNHNPDDPLSGRVGSASSHGTYFDAQSLASIGKYASDCVSDVMAKNLAEIFPALATKMETQNTVSAKLPSGDSFSP